MLKNKVKEREEGRGRRGKGQFDSKWIEIELGKVKNRIEAPGAARKLRQ